MSRIFRKLRSLVFPFDKYFRNIFVVFSGTSVSFLIPILVVPFLTYLYSPQEFGSYGFTYSIGTLLGIFSTLRYENLIMIAKSTEEAFHAQRLCEFLILGINIIIFVFILGFILYFPIRNSSYLNYLDYVSIPLIAMSMGLFRVKTLMANKNEKFKRVSQVRVLQGILIAGLSVFFGKVNFILNGMILAHILGNFACASCLHQKIPKFIQITKKDLLNIARKHSNFFKFSLPAEIFNNIAIRYPLMVFPYMFGSEVTGFLTLAYRVIAIPARFISTAISEVFFQQASKESREKGSFQHLFFLTTALLTVLSILGFGALYFTIDFIFYSFFPPQWFITSTYIKILTPLFFINFIVSPLSTIIYVSEKQSWDFLWQCFYLLMIMLCTLLSWFFGGNIEIVLGFLSLGASISYCVYFYLLLILTKKSGFKKFKHG